MAKNKKELLARLDELNEPGHSEDETNEALEQRIAELEGDADGAVDGSAEAPDPSELEHSEGGSTTKDALDLGVPMLQGDPSEPTGPEDALGEGPKRGDYSDRQDGSAHFESVANPRAGEPVKKWVKDGVEVDEGTKGAESITVDFEPAFIPVQQNDRVYDVGEVPGEKGGVTTA